MTLIKTVWGRLFIVGVSLVAWHVLTRIVWHLISVIPSSITVNSARTSGLEYTSNIGEIIGSHGFALVILLLLACVVFIVLIVSMCLYGLVAMIGYWVATGVFVPCKEWIGTRTEVGAAIAKAKAARS